VNATRELEALVAHVEQQLKSATGIVLVAGLAFLDEARTALTSEQSAQRLLASLETYS